MPQVSRGIPAAEIVPLATLVNYQDGSIVSRVLMGGQSATVTLFAFDGGQALNEHTAPFDAMVYVLEGEAEITVSAKPLRVHPGEAVLMPANEPHAVRALARFKMLLVMVRS